MGGTVQANDGAMLPLDSLAQQFTYAGGFVTSISVYYQGNNYVQTFLNDGTNITYISGWNNLDAPIAQQVMVSESGQVMVDQSGQIMITE